MTNDTTKPQDRRDIEAREALQKPGAWMEAQTTLVSPDAESTLQETVERTIEVIERQLDLIGERAPGEMLDKRPVVQSLQAHARRLRAALARPAPEALGAAFSAEEITRLRASLHSQVETELADRVLRVIGAEALGAAKGVELSDAEISRIAMAVEMFHSEFHKVSTEAIIKFARAILAKAMGDS